MNIPLEKPIHSPARKIQSKIEVPTKLVMITIANPIADLKAQLKSHLAKNHLLARRIAGA